MAAAGLVVVGVEFQNAVDETGQHPFPAGLDDITAAARWVSVNRAELGISALVLQGDSGGANLALAATIRAAREARTNLVDGVRIDGVRIDGIHIEGIHIDGVYASVPSISGRDE